MSDKRVIDLIAETTLQAGDYIMVDSSSDGTRKFDIGSELTTLNAKIETAGAIEIYVDGTSLIINTNITDGNEVEY